MIQLTDSALSAVRTAIAGAGPDVEGLRIMVEAGGCAGFKYMMGLVSEANPSDVLFEREGVKVYVEEGSLAYLDGAKVDFVIGLEGSLNYADITDKYDGHKGTYGFNGSITPRIGYAMGDFLPYIKAGLAFGDVEINRFGAKDSQWQVGWTAGFGAEYRVTPEVSVRAEYNYTSYGKDDFDIRSGIVKAGYSGSDIKLGVNYHF